MLNDLRFAIRMLLKDPSFTAVAVLTLTLGIGSNTAIFSVVNSVLLRSLPYKSPDRIVMLWHTNPKLQIGIDELAVPANIFLKWREHNEAFEQMAALEAATFNLAGLPEPETLAGARVSAGLFAVLGIQPLLGRSFTPDEDQPSRDHVIIMSYDLWKRRFGSDPQLVGKSLIFDGDSYTVIGVMPPGFYFPRGNELPAYLRLAPRTDLWKPMAFTSEEIQNQDNFNFAVIARLKPGIPLEQARSEMNTITARIAKDYPPWYKDFGVIVTPFQEDVVRNIRLALVLLLSAVALVLLIACVNMANLLIARATGRQKEFAIRMALGAGRGRLIKQLLTESVLLGLLSGSLGILLSVWGLDLLRSFGPENLPRLEEVNLDARVLGFALLISITTGVLFGLAPAVTASKTTLNESLKEGTMTVSGGLRRSRMHRLLVVFEIALSLMLLISAGLVIKSFWRLMLVNPGFSSEKVLTLDLSFSPSMYPDAAQRTVFLQQAIQRIVALPGAKAAGTINDLPLTGDANISSTVIEGRPLVPGEEPIAEHRFISPGYFQAMGIPLIRGRYFTEQDTKKSVVLINESAGRRFWPGENPIGKRLKRESNADWLEVVGVVQDVRHSSLEAYPRPQVYWPYFLGSSPRMTLVIRAALEPQRLVRAIKNEIWKIDKSQPVANIKTMEQIVSDSVSKRRFQMLLLGVFAGLALVLAMVGIYGVMSYSVTQRTREIGIRMALGAQAGDVLNLVVRQGMLLALMGVAMGLAGALALTRLLSSLLYGVTATDPATFASVSLLLGGVALLASYLPARRAAKVDPMVALRYE